jgi:squalene-hopene/tetraprenyl-beta-curcumene cyclase
MPVRNGIFRARQYLVGRQRLDGSWAGVRSGDVVSLSELVLLHTYLGREQSECVEQAARAIRRDQLAEGGWALQPGEPINSNASVLAYFALKTAGDDPCEPAMRRARTAIRASGGADAIDMATRRWLALLGQIDYDCCPAIAPEQLLLPSGLATQSAANELRWAALSVVSALRPVRKLELSRGIRELFILTPCDWPIPNGTSKPKRSAALDGLWSWCDRIGWLPFRRWALDTATSRLLGPVIGADCCESSMDELAWRWIALAALGFDETNPTLMACERQLKRLVVIDAELDEARSRPETSLTADTALVIESLQSSGLDTAHPDVAAGIGWLLEHRVPRACESRETRELTSMLRTFVRLEMEINVAASVLPPDIKMNTGRRANHARVPIEVHRPIVEKLRERVCVQQRPDGGWSAWGVMSDDPRRCGAIRSVDNRSAAESSPGATGAMLDVLSSSGRSGGTAAIRDAVEFLRFYQRGDGSWSGVTDAGTVYDTAWVVRGLVAAGVALDDSCVAAGVNWLLVHQQESGNWGESDASAIQTAWALLALVAAGQADLDAARRAVWFLVDAQHDDGSWSDRQPSEYDSTTGGWYCNDLQATALPTLALANWAVSIAAQGHDRPVALRLICDESPH